MDSRERPAEAGTSAGRGQRHTGGAEHSATPRKWQRVLAAFVEGRTFNRFDAYRELRDSCLNTTISQIEQRGVTILRREETVPGHFGPVYVKRYWIAPDALQRAHELLGLPSADEPPRDACNALEAAA